jgi:hypothetical protein
LGKKIPQKVVVISKKYFVNPQGDEMKEIDDKVMEVLIEIRDHPAVKTGSTSLSLAVGDLVKRMATALAEKSLKSKQAHQGYVVWKSRCLNYANIIMEMRFRKAAADRKGKN